jgi:H+/Cl- antiporter ClcA
MSMVYILIIELCFMIGANCGLLIARWLPRDNRPWCVLIAGFVAVLFSPWLHKKLGPKLSGRGPLWAMVILGIALGMLALWGLGRLWRMHE